MVRDDDRFIHQTSGRLGYPRLSTALANDVLHMALSND